MSTAGSFQHYNLAAIILQGQVVGSWAAPSPAAGPAAAAAAAAGAMYEADVNYAPAVAAAAAGQHGPADYAMEGPEDQGLAAAAAAFAPAVVAAGPAAAAEPAAPAAPAMAAAGDAGAVAAANYTGVRMWRGRWRAQVSHNKVSWPCLHNGIGCSTRHAQSAGHAQEISCITFESNTQA